jgi:hypothetical protein
MHLDSKSDNFVSKRIVCLHTKTFTTETQRHRGSK